MNLKSKDYKTILRVLYLKESQAIPVYPNVTVSTTTQFHNITPARYEQG